ncbi:hypothetical protein OIV83_006302 [Microbotryomycetes sp. JL201]|nr:hypothetical protein OIV83_006302 [Microbotryomycetes sp. JL201]
MSVSADEFLDVLNAEQYVDLDKLRSFARYGIPANVRGEVWLYLLGVLSQDRTNEITSVRSKYASYTAMDKNPIHSNRIRLECTRYYQRKLLPQIKRRRQQQQYQHAQATAQQQQVQAQAHAQATAQPDATPPAPAPTSMALATGNKATVPLPDPDSSSIAGGALARSRTFSSTQPAKSGTLSLQSTIAGRDDEPIDIVAFTTSVENVISAYLNRNTSLEYNANLVQMAAPVSPAHPRSAASVESLTLASPFAQFVWTLKTEAGMYFCFERLMSMYEDYTSARPLSARMSFFLMLFRQFLPDLHAYFEEEAVDMRELASAWLDDLFAREMQIATLMRVWDVYFSINDPLEFHTYVCLSILMTLKESLEELDQSEVRSMLLSLPPLDVDRLIVEATNLRLSYQHSQPRSGH